MRIDNQCFHDIVSDSGPTHKSMARLHKSEIAKTPDTRYLGHTVREFELQISLFYFSESE